MDFRQRRARILAFARSDVAKRYFQWRQTPAGEDNRFADGALGCYATCGQYLVRLWTGRHVSMDDFGAAGGYPTTFQRYFRKGMTGPQVEAALRHFGVPYRFVKDISARQVMRHLRARGPVIIECTYGFYPEWRGATYGAAKADGRPNGFARPFGKAGKTQLTGFENGRHAVLALAKYHRANTPAGATSVYMHDPNHGSAVRKERPDFDIITLNQFDRLLKSGASTALDRRVHALIPTRAWEGTPQ